MKKMTLVLMAAMVCGIAFAAQDTSFTIREVRDPVQLKAKLEANASDAETRLTAAGATATSAITLTNSADNGVCALYLHSDIDGDAGDYGALITTAAGNLLWQTDQAAAGTLATKLTLGNSGVLTMKGSATIDNTTSATVLALTETTIDLAGLTTTDEVDARTATALLLGKATATSVTIGASDAGVSVPGTLGVTGVATLTAAPKLTAVVAPGATTATMTNAPTLSAAASPVWISVTIGTTSYVVPAFALP